MEGVDISQFSEEEQRILRNVFARAQDEEERDKIKFREEQERIRLLEAAVANLRQKAGVDLESTCNICFKTKFADGIGHICSQCGRRCCARCGVKVPLRLNKIWLCILCRKNKELAIKFGNWALKKEAGPQTQKSWGRSRSLEEEANTERQSSIPLLKRHFTSNLNIANTSLPFWNDEKKQQPAARPDPLPPPLEGSSPQPHSSRGDPSGDGQVLQRRYTRRRSSLDTIRNDSLSSDQSENPPAARRPKPKKANGHRYRRSGSSESEDEARSSPSSCQDSESDRVSMRKEKSSIRPHETRWRSQEDYQHITSHNVYWKLSQDGRQYVGHMTLRKELKPDGTRENLGMRVVGGHVIDEDSGTTGAIVETLKEGSLADRVGRIQPDDEVLEWNGIRLRNLYKEEVADIIGVSKNDPQVQLLVSRPCGINVPSPLDPIDGRRLPPPHMEIHPEAMQRDAPSSRYHDRHSSYPPSRNQVATIGGKIKVRVWYDPNDLQLVGTVERAIDLPPRPDQSPRTTYVRVCLLPDWGEKYRRRSKCIARSNDPQWNLSFVFSHLRQSELRNRTLQISVWNYEKNGSNDFLGEVLIPLRNLRADSQWYNLSKHHEEPTDNNPSPPVSPPASRVPSDEELSDYDEKFLEHTERRIMAVDSSPPFYEEERRRQSTVPFLAPAIMPPMMGERSRSMAAPSPSVEYSRGRMREPGYGDRRRSRSMADYTTRHMPSHGSRSVSPPQYRSEFQSLPRISSAHRLMPPQNSLRKRQLPLVPARNELEERYLRGRNSVSGSTSTYGNEYDRFVVPRRGGGSRMAAALGVSATSPLISPDRSDSESSSKFNLSSAFHRNSRTFEEFRGRSSDYGGPVHPSSREMDGSLSDTAVGLMDKAKVNVHRSTPTDSNNRSPYLSKKSRSTSQLSGAGHKKLQIFRRRNGSSSSLVVQRSEEILPDVRAGSSISSDGSISGDSLTWGSRLPPEVGEASSFVEGLGPGQLVGRQALASAYLGEVQLGICEKRNCLEVEVIRARGLLPKANSKVLPTPYIKVYLLDGRRCIAKRKTVLARRTLDPLYQQVLTFTEDFRHCCMQVTVWGNYSSMERKVFMGVVQILLDDIDLVKGVIDWYRLFHHSSLINSLTRNDRSSFLSLDSFG